MFALALLPLVGYFAFLTHLYFRKTPTVLDGSLDFMLLVWGLFGLITLGPGRLLIPLYLFTAWGIYTWIFWFVFYLMASYLLSLQFRNRFVVYHCRREWVLPAFFTLSRQIDPKAEWCGHVLSLHGLGVQWAVITGRFGGYLLFMPTNPYGKSPYQDILREQLTNLCRTLIIPRGNHRWFWASLTFALLCLAVGLLIRDFPMLIQQFSEHWKTSSYT